MNHTSIINFSKGRVHYVNQFHKYVEVGNKLILVTENDKSKIIFKGFSYLKYFPFYNKYKRLLRKGIHHFIPFGEKEKGYIIKDNYKAVVVDNELYDKTPLLGSRPLKVCLYQDQFYYGVYRGNPEKTPIPLIRYSQGRKWEQVFVFTGITHIHGVFFDEFENKFWVTVGDENNEAAIYKFNQNWSNPEKVVSGSQQARAIVVLFDKEYIYYGTDTPYDKNFIYQLDRKDYSVIEKTAVNASVFHGCSLSEWMFFSTAVEPSEINKSKFASIYASKNGGEWKCVLKVKKDFWDMKYFQYGQIFFPQGEGDGENLWFSLFATKRDNTSVSITFEELTKIYQSGEAVSL